jgi:hypothetical protein
MIGSSGIGLLRRCCSVDGDRGLVVERAVDGDPPGRREGDQGAKSIKGDRSMTIVVTAG